jgi:hypothetical protein
MTRTVTPRRFEEELLQALLREHAVVPMNRRPPTIRSVRRPLAAGALGVAATATAVAVAVSTLGGGPSSEQRDASGREGPAVFAEGDATLIVSRSQEAIAESDATILHAEHSSWPSPEATGPMSRTELWFDQSDAANRRVLYYGEDGQPLLDQGFARDGDLLQTRSVDHARRSVTEIRTSAEELVGEGAPQLDVDPAKITDAIATGELTVVGEETLDGTLHLRGTEPDATRDLWVDESTYLPVRATASGAFGSYEINYHWEPRTDTTLSELLPPVPDGYTTARPST